MPIYEYACAACGRDFEKYVATVTAAVVCPHCASDRITRRLSVVGVKAGAVMSGGGGGGCCGGGCGCH